ncbi:CopY/TcrY family copper transport repressor [Streptococcus pseudoporcinus]|uniref:Putative negative transcriptional regulator n=1 Tax=Streptococcus pseudoporcinus TaxID=361101 RepID=A0A4U9Y5H5_9STRE|nr:CopY/TcrY family copper transport repressor [Streptococcus pseudoporcinus]VTS21162.1 putative negative transcriptional regulator [Streptococcus pseudoporcinus]VUC69463.1 putative negative transcriptional regulator [Streptococcus pseudoporcinus]VUC99862.1 putative negative transcriptional regulator [Streptococcus pseudoporcinus]VUD00256.1 putative negative transcriptional regulator [Streptococcus pseudoporcinus]
MLKISAAEWQVMRIIWANKAIKSSEIITILKDNSHWSQSTIKTLLGRLIDKGLVKAQREGRAFIYQASIQQMTYQKKMLADDFSRICQKEHPNLLLDLLADMPMTEEVLQAFKTLLEEKAGKLVDHIPCNCPLGQCKCHQKVGD